MSSQIEVNKLDNKFTKDEYENLPKNKISVILDNLRSAYNVGSIFRTADAARIEKIMTCGYTASPPHKKLEKTALGTEKFVKNIRYKSADSAIKNMQKNNIKVIAIETAVNAKKFTSFEFPKPVCLIVGNEALGISKSALSLADDIVHIPLFGYKNSINVVCAFSVVLFEILRQWNYKI